LAAGLGREENLPIAGSDDDNLLGTVCLEMAETVETIRACGIVWGSKTVHNVDGGRQQTGFGVSAG